MNESFEGKTYIETFTDFDDASLWLEKALDNNIPEGWVIEQAQITFVNQKWRVGLAVVSNQQELPFIN